MSEQNELDRAIERLETELAISESDGDQFSRDIKTVCDSAKRLKEYAYLEDSDNQHKVDVIRERDQLRTEYKKALGALEESFAMCDDVDCHHGKPHHPDCTVAKRYKVLSTQLAIETLKKDSNE